MKRKLGLVLIIAGALILLAPVWMSLEGAYYQYELKHQWEQAVDQYKAAEARKTRVRRPPVLTTPAAPAREEPPKALPLQRTTSRVLSKRFPLTEITIPSIGVSAIVVEGVSMRALSKGPGHFPGTAPPGAPGNCCIAGHRNMSGSWFRRLNEVSPGDLVTLSTPDAEFDYRVTSTFKVLPDDVDVLRQTSQPTLTLVTCTPVPHPTHRLIVTAELWRQRP